MIVDYNPDKVAAQTAATFAQLREEYGQQVAIPNREPLYSKRHDGAIVNRQGNVIREPLPQPTKGAAHGKG
jgi:hypothetical protein